MKVNENNVKKLKWMGYFYTAVSFFYWVWAIINTIPDPSDFDYGCISFCGVAEYGDIVLSRNSTSGKK